MFTGLVTDVGILEESTVLENGRVFSIRPTQWDTSLLVLGESISVNGVCLTVTETSPSQFKALVGAETLQCTTFGKLQQGTQVNLERALLATDRLGGHWVSGHVDCVGVLKSVSRNGTNTVMEISLDAQWKPYLIHKGSLCIDGVSLTLNKVVDRADSVSVSVGLIPHTLQETNLSARKAGDEVNIEIDIFAKYFQRMIELRNP